MRGLGCRRGALTLAVCIGATTAAFDAVLLPALDREEGLNVRCARARARRRFGQHKRRDCNGPVMLEPDIEHRHVPDQGFVRAAIQDRDRQRSRE